MIRHIILLLFFACHLSNANANCGQNGVWLQVHGSGGPELGDKRASSSYLIWHDGNAKLLVDIGSGSMLHLEKASVNINDLEAVLLTHLHVDHSSDLPALIKASFFSQRTKDLLIYGPSGNALMPSTSSFIQLLFGPNGAYRYLSSYLDGSESYTIKPYDITFENRQAQTIIENTKYQLTAAPTHHGPIPAIAWKIMIGGKTIVFSGDMNNDNHTLYKLANNADLLIAHHAVPEVVTGVARNLHMPPSVIGQIAVEANVKQLVLSHHMLRSLQQIKNSDAEIRESYKGPVHFANDMQCFQP
jgi:ribonuclease BN (tRNA processing enzyme)